MEELMQELNEAYEMLENCITNEEFDSWQKTIDTLEKELELV